MTLPLWPRPRPAPAPADLDAVLTAEIEEAARRAGIIPPPRPSRVPNERLTRPVAPRNVVIR